LCESDCQRPHKVSFEDCHCERQDCLAICARVRAHHQSRRLLKPFIAIRCNKKCNCGTRKKRDCWVLFTLNCCADPHHEGTQVVNSKQSGPRRNSLKNLLILRLESRTKFGHRLIKIFSTFLRPFPTTLFVKLARRQLFKQPLQRR
jgi:hypothetical protein